MLNYKISLNGSSIVPKPITVISAYVAHDLSYISGVTYAYEHLETMSTITVESNYSRGIQTCDITTENRQRQGLLQINNQVIGIQSDTVHVDGEYSSELTTVRYVDFNGKYYYVFKNQQGDEQILFDDIIDINGNLCPTLCSVSDNTVSLTYSVWVDDKTVFFNGKKYIVEDDYFDGSSSHTFCLVEEEGGDPIFVDGELNMFDKESRYDVTYFQIFTPSEVRYKYLSLSCGNRIYLTSYHNNIRKLTNIGTVNNPIFGVDNLTTNYACPVSGVCYLRYNNGNTTAIQGEVYTQFINNSLPFEYEDIWLSVEGDDTKYPVTTDLQSSNEGDFLLFYANKMYIDGVGERITFRGETIPTVKPMLVDYLNNDYIIFNGKKYIRIEDLCCQVKINGEYFDATPNGNDAFDVSILGSVVKMYTTEDGNKVENRNATVRTEEKLVYQTYDLIHRDGVQINGVNYPILENIDESPTPSVKLDIADEIAFVVNANNGNNLMELQPYFDSLDFAQDDTHSLCVDICSALCEAQSQYSPYGMNRTFGSTQIRVGVGYKGLERPSSSETDFSVLNNVKIYGHNGNFILTMPITIKTGENSILDNTRETDFYDEASANAVNKIVDMERDVYYPESFVTSDGKIKLENGYPKTQPIYQLDFNFHFRTRDLDNWKVIDKNTAISNGIVNGDGEPKCNWFVTDYEPYSSLLSTKGDKLEEMSDLLGLLYFTNGDVFYQKKKLEKTFVQLSFYDSTNPQTQSLLYTSTIFFDENYAHQKYISNRKKQNITIFKNVSLNDNTDAIKSQLINVISEPYINNDIQDDDTKRLSSRFSVVNKYETKTSSDGFYLYIFKEYSQMMHLTPIYMKVEFKHAGIGQTLPMIIPMDWEVENDCAKPTKKLSLKNDLEKLKSGYTLSDIYMQTYIPLYVTYDRNTNKYCYIFDDRYVSVKDGVAKLNMFELKIADEDKEGLNASTYSLINNKWLDENS